MRSGWFFACFFALSGSALAAPHGVRLTHFGDPTTSIAVSWNSNDAGDAELAYGTSPGALTSTLAATVTTQPAPLGSSFTARLTGLTPGTTYYYRVAGYPADEPYSFTTLP